MVNASHKELGTPLTEEKAQKLQSPCGEMVNASGIHCCRQRQHRLFVAIPLRGNGKCKVNVKNVGFGFALLQSPCGEMVNASGVGHVYRINADFSLHSPCGEMVNASWYDEEYEVLGYEMLHSPCGEMVNASSNMVKQMTGNVVAFPLRGNGKCKLEVWACN